MKKKRNADRLKKRAAAVISRLIKTYPEASTALRHTSALELLVSTILSAQCTDERVNGVTEKLFRRYRTADEYAGANLSELENLIKPTGFYRVKARNIISSCKIISEEHGGNVPDAMDLLLRLPGVGRKTANVILGNFFGKAEGIVVDTHVKRLSGRLGFSKQTDPEKIEADLTGIIPKKYWIAMGNLLIIHGRNICKARKPKCPECLLNKTCPSAG